jgi:predicted dehydrogenase
VTHAPVAAVVGTGFIGPVHVEALRRAGVRVAGILGSTPAKSRTAANKLGLPRGYETFDEVLRDPEVDCVHVTSPNRFHFEQARAALLAGKRVLCEKPLATNPRDSAELVRVASETGLAAGVAYNVRFYPLCHEAAARLRSGEAGELLHVHGAYVQDWLLFPGDFNWRVLADEGGALRAVADIGTHWLDLIQFVTGRRVVSVCADLRTVHPVRTRPRGGVETFAGPSATPVESESVTIDTEDCGSVLLRFDNGANGVVWVSQTTAGRKNRLSFEVAGSRRALAWNSETPDEMWIGARDRPNELVLRDPALLDPFAGRFAQYPAGHNEGFPDTFKQLFRAFYGAWNRSESRDDCSGTAPYPTFADGHREVLLCEAVLGSHRKRGWVDVAE